MEESIESHDNGVPAVYSRRWFVVFVLWWLNLCSGLLWISYATIVDETRKRYSCSVDEVNWLSLVFPIFTIVLGLPVIFALEHLGLRISFNTCAMLNLLAATLRLLCAYNSVSLSSKYAVAMVGQCLAALAQPWAMFSPARLAAVWFPPSQRVIATTLSSFGNPLGILLGSLLPPFIVKHSSGFITLAVSLFAVSLVGALLSVLGICHSSPPRPPAVSSDRPSLIYGFFAQLKICIVNRHFLFLAFSFGVGLGLFTTLSTLIEQILCPYGYSQTFAGNCGALLIGCGLVGALISGMVADRTKALAEITQVCIILTIFGMIIFSILSVFSSIEACIMASICWIGFFGIAIYSVCFELAAEITYPASENVSTGLLVIAGQVFSVVFILLSSVLTRPITVITVDPTCVSSHSYLSFWVLNMFMSGSGVLGSFIMLIFFKATYQRRLMEDALISTENNYGGDVVCSSSEFDCS